MRIGKMAFIVAATLAFGCAQALPVIEANIPLGNNTHGIALDVVLVKAYVTNHDDGTVSIIDQHGNVTTIPVGSKPNRIIADVATHLVYLTNSTSPGTVTVINGATDTVVAVIPVGNNPTGIAADFLIGELYVTNNGSNTVSAISTATNSVIATIPVGNSPSDPDSNNLLKKLYVVNSADHTVSAIDELTHAVVKVIAVGLTPIKPAIDAQHAQVYVNNVADKTVSVIDSTTDTVVALVPSGQGQSGGGGASANFVTVSPVYHRAYLPNAVDGTLTIIDTDTNTVTHTVAVGTSPVDTVVDANGGNIYVVNQGSNSVSILDAGTETVIAALAVGGAPKGAATAVGLLFVVKTNGAAPDSLIVATTEDTLPNTSIATEFYHAIFNHYFHTADEIETDLLLDGVFGDDWHRTFEFWRVWTAPSPGRLPVCRFFSTAFGALSSHFYTPYAAECATLQADPAHVWELESPAVYYLALPDDTGTCPAGTVPLYRLYNNGMGGAPNHRYTADRAVRDMMIPLGWTPEGSGPDIVFACIPTLLSG
jgi:YVTN family beta-propeller protein